MIVVANAASAQQIANNKLPFLITKSSQKPAYSNVQLHQTLRQPSVGSASLPTIAPNFYSGNLGFFCKQEIKFEKVIKFPFRFRLGSVADCDRLEGKPNTNFRQ